MVQVEQQGVLLQGPLWMHVGPNTAGGVTRLKMSLTKGHAAAGVACAHDTVCAWVQHSDPAVKFCLLLNPSTPPTPRPIPAAHM
jgi:hypothetical protein